MKIVYFSKTNNVKRFCEKLNYPVIQGYENLMMDEDYILIIYTTGFGEVPKSVSLFLEYNNNYKYLRGVCGSGNKNWGINYAKAADVVSQKYSVPLLMKFELSGNVHNINRFETIYGGLINNE